MKFRSVNSIVIPPASTGSDKINRSAVKKIAQINRGIRYIVIALVRMFIIVVIKLIDLRIDEIPARCSLNIAKSTPLLECVCIPDRGGYKVHPVPTPFSTKLEDSSKNKEGGSNQNLMLFIKKKKINDYTLTILNQSQRHRYIIHNIWYIWSLYRNFTKNNNTIRVIPNRNFTRK